jgi:GTP-binding protein
MYFISREWMFFDVATINVKAGDGGDGCMAMQREFRVAFGGPCGGNGGNGGSIYLQCDKRLNTLGLLRRKVHHRARYGTIGKGDSRHGASAEDVYVPVPPGERAVCPVLPGWSCECALCGFDDCITHL